MRRWIDDVREQMLIDEVELERIIVAAYTRGANWVYENPSADDKAYLNKAARDYADKTIAIYKGAGLEQPEPVQ